MADPESLDGLFHQHRHDDPLPSGRVLGEIIDLLREILFPGYFGGADFNMNTLKYTMGVRVERLYSLLVEQIMAGLCFTCTDCSAPAGRTEWEVMMEKARLVAGNFVSSLPQLRRTLATDVEATYNGDPAALSFGEIICCYPVIKALINYRMAHRLLGMGVPIIPRMITEMAHSETGIDIHPGAQIGHHFTIDHGTGVVIGATCIIGNHVQLYQGVTLGAKSFPLDEEGNPIKHIPRHPILRDHVVVYSNATILGRITVGEGAVIGGNLWVTEDVPPGARLSQNFKT